MAKKFPAHPKNPERLCWGCDQYCAADQMRCGNGSDRTQHPVELFGEDWQDWAPREAPAAGAEAQTDRESDAPPPGSTPRAGL